MQLTLQGNFASLAGGPSPVCRLCGQQTSETIDHFLFECGDAVQVLERVPTWDDSSTCKAAGSSLSAAREVVLWVVAA